MSRFNLTIYDQPEVEKGIKSVADEEEISFTQAATKLVKEALRARGKLPEVIRR
jgi:hypothetical protein